MLLPGEVGLWSVSRPSVTLSPGVEDGLKGGTLEQVLLTVEDTSPSPVERFVATLRLEGNGLCSLPLRFVVVPPFAEILSCCLIVVWECRESHLCQVLAWPALSASGCVLDKSSVPF